MLGSLFTKRGVGFDLGITLIQAPDWKCGAYQATPDKHLINLGGEKQCRVKFLV